MRAQIATEYLFIMTFATVLLVGYLAAAAAFSSDAVDAGHDAQAERIARQIQSEIVLATQVRDGYNRTVMIDEEAAGAPVSIRNGSGVIEVSVGGSTTSVRTPPYQGTPVPGTNTIIKDGASVIWE